MRSAARWSLNSMLLMLNLTGLISFAHAAETPLSWRLHGEEVALRAPMGLGTTRDLEVLEPHEGATAHYRAIALKPLLDAIYGPAWRNEEELLVSCADGYQPSLPVRMLQDHEPYLAFAKAGTSEFTLDNRLQGEQDVPLGPYYLVWDNLQDQSGETKWAGAWPYQVVALDFIRFEDRFAGLLPAKPLSGSEYDGFLAFRRHCMSCHQVNGAGGGKSRDLNQPNILTLRDRAWLEQFLKAPNSLRPGIAMPELDVPRDRQDAVIDALLDYLQLMHTGEES